MRRDMDLIRELMLKLEAFPLKARGIYTISFDDSSLAVEDRSHDEIVYHLGLIHGARFTEPYGSQGMDCLTFSGLTWEGHDFIDSIRDPKIWTDTKSALRSAGGFTIELLGAVAKGLLKNELRKLGIPIDN